MLALRHVHKQKKQSKKAPYATFDYVIYFMSFIGPIMTLPQIYDIWVRRSFSINEITWGSYLFFAGIWLYYGILHKEKPIIVSNFLWILVDGLVVLGAIVLH